jgi:hypothetical protein
MNSKLLETIKTENKEDLSCKTNKTESELSQQPEAHELLAGLKILAFLKGIRKIRQAIVSKLADTLISSQVRTFLSKLTQLAQHVFSCLGS